MLQAEIEKYRYLSDAIDDENIKKRAQASLEYFINKASLYKRLWRWLSVRTILLPATATFLAACSGKIGGIQDITCLLAGITALTTIVSSLLSLSKCTDKRHRTAIQQRR